MVIYVERGDGRPPQVNGGPGLKPTQAYPPEFGVAIAAIVVANWASQPVATPLAPDETGEPVAIEDIAVAPGSGYPEAELSSAISLLLGMCKLHRKRKASEM